MPKVALASWSDLLSFYIAITHAWTQWTVFTLSSGVTTRTQTSLNVLSVAAKLVNGHPQSYLTGSMLRGFGYSSQIVLEQYRHHRVWVEEYWATPWLSRVSKTIFEQTFFRGTCGLIVMSPEVDLLILLVSRNSFGHSDKPTHFYSANGTLITDCHRDTDGQTQCDHCYFFQPVLPAITKSGISSFPKAIHISSAVRLPFPLTELDFRFSVYLFTSLFHLSLFPPFPSTHSQYEKTIGKCDMASRIRETRLIVLFRIQWDTKIKIIVNKDER